MQSPSTSSSVQRHEMNSFEQEVLHRLDSRLGGCLHVGASNETSMNSNRNSVSFQFVEYGKWCFELAKDAYKKLFRGIILEGEIRNVNGLFAVRKH